MKPNLLHNVFAAAALITAGIENHAQGKAENSLAEVWASMKAQSIPYDFLPPRYESFTDVCATGPQNYAAPGNIIAVQVESERNSYMGFLLHRGRDMPVAVAKQHGEAAASILNAAADRSGYDIPVYYMESPNSLHNWIDDPALPDTKALFSSAAVVCLSMSPINEGPQEAQYSSGNVSTIRRVEEAREFWAMRPNTIMVQSAGNWGKDEQIKLERHTANHFLYAHNYIQVGEARRMQGGEPVIRDHSSRSGPAFVTLNPFSSGFMHQYYYTGDDLRQQIDKIFQSYTPDSTNTVAGAFERTVVNYGNQLREWIAKRREDRPANPFTLTDRRLLIMDFEGKNLLLSDDPKNFSKDRLGDVRKAFVNALVAAANREHKSEGANDDGFITGRNGTSFSAPEASGMIAAQYQLHPDLGAGTLLSAAFIAANPVTLREWEDCLESLEYKDNGSGLHVNQETAGFGFLDEKAYANEVSALDEMRISQNLSVQEVRISTGLKTWKDYTHAQDDSVPKNMREHRFRIEEDAIVRKIQLSLIFASGASTAPAHVTLINPQGKSVDISTTMPYTGTVSSGMTDLHFGVHAAGEWRLRIPEALIIDLGQVDIIGPVTDGVVAKRLQDLRNSSPSVTPPASLALVPEAP